MNSHIIVTVLLCTVQCEPAEIQVWNPDTLELRVTREVEAIRISRIDAPKINGQCAYEADLGQRSESRLTELMAAQQLAIRRHGTDRYGRTLAATSITGADAVMPASYWRCDPGKMMSCSTRTLKR